MTRESADSTRIFLSYRRDDVPDAVDRIADRLKARFGDRYVFVDVTAIRAGEKWRDALFRALDRCEAMLVVIGPNWLRPHGDDGGIALDDPNDFVRREIQVALEREILIIPVLWGTEMPSRGLLPAELRRLTESQGFTMRREHFESDVRMLFERIDAQIKLLATLGRRAASFVVDLIPPLLVNAVVGGTLTSFLILLIVYHCVFVGAIGRTLGKWLMGTTVESDEPPGRRWVFALARPLCGYPFVLASGIGTLQMVLHPQHRAVHDRLFRTRVVRTRRRPIAAGHLWIDALSHAFDEWLFKMLLGLRLGFLIWWAKSFFGIERLLEGLEEGLSQFAAQSGGGSQVAAGTAVASSGSGALAGAGLLGGGAVAAMAAPLIVGVALAVGSLVIYERVTSFIDNSEPYRGIREPELGVVLDEPAGIVLGPEGAVYVADAGHHRIRRVAPNGLITTVAGSGGSGFDGDGGRATRAQLDSPTGVAIGPDSGLYVADQGNDRVRRIGPDGRITTFAGGGNEIGDGGPATRARLRGPHDLAFGGDGSLYIADTWNQRVRRVLPEGTIVTIAGTGEPGFGGDGGPAREALLNYPDGIAVDRDDNVLIADRRNLRVRRVSRDGIISTLAGGGVGGLGDGGPATEARFDRERTPGAPRTLYRGLYPGTGLAVGNENDLYVARFPFELNTVRRVRADGTIHTVAGGGERDRGDGMPATEAKLRWPSRVAVGHDNSLFITEFIADYEGGGRLRRVLPDGTITTVRIRTIDFAVDRVEHEDEVQISGPRGTLTVFWSGTPRFPVRLVYRPIEGVPQPPGRLDRPEKVFRTEENPLVFPEAIYAIGGSGPYHFYFEVVLIDADGNQTEPAPAPFTAVSER